MHNIEYGLNDTGVDGSYNFEISKFTRTYSKYLCPT